jgi:hypothetical protein
MKNQFYNDQAHIAESFNLTEEFTAQTARLAYFKLNSYKLSLVKSSFIKTREELMDNIRGSLMNYTSPEIILADLGFFSSQVDN